MPSHGKRYQTSPDPTAECRETIWSGARMLGGSSAINGMIYTRGLRGDYDAWSSSGCPGWDFDSLSLHPLTHAFMRACNQVGIPVFAAPALNDASIMPNIISGNTNAATMAIAEKAADLIRTKKALQP